MGVSKMGQIISKMGICKMGIGRMGVNPDNILND